MEYYLLPLEEKEAVKVEDALKKINYDLDDQTSTWNQKDIDEIVNTMTKENAPKLIVEFLPDEIGDKFANLFGFKH